jgi:hypothetical protein
VSIGAKFAVSFTNRFEAKRTVMRHSPHANTRRHVSGDHATGFGNDKRGLRGGCLASDLLRISGKTARQKTAAD